MILRLYMLLCAGRNGLVVTCLATVRENPYRITQVRIIPPAFVFITTATAIYSLGHWLPTLFTAVPRSTQPSTLYETVNVYQLSG